MTIKLKNMNGTEHGQNKHMSCQRLVNFEWLPIKMVYWHDSI